MYGGKAELLAVREKQQRDTGYGHWVVVANETFLGMTFFAYCCLQAETMDEKTGCVLVRVCIRVMCV